MRPNCFEIEEQITECRDAKDNKFLELAVCGHATFLISGDKDLLVLHPFRDPDRHPESVFSCDSARRARPVAEQRQASRRNGHMSELGEERWRTLTAATALRVWAGLTSLSLSSPCSGRVLELSTDGRCPMSHGLATESHRG